MSARSQTESSVRGHKVQSFVGREGPGRCQFAGLIPTFSDYPRGGSGSAGSYLLADGLPILARREQEGWLDSLVAGLEAEWHTCFPGPELC
jgi:hypothetical protein